MNIRKREVITGTLEEIKEYYSKILGTREEMNLNTPKDKIGYHCLDAEKFNHELENIRDKQSGLGRVFYFKNTTTTDEPITLSMELLSEIVDVRPDGESDKYFKTVSVDQKKL